MNKLLALILLFAAATLSAQMPQSEMQIIDSLTNLLKTQSANKKIQTLELLIAQYQNLAPYKGIETGENALRTNDFAKDPEARIRILRSMANSAQYAGDFELAEQYLRQSILLSRNANNQYLLCEMLTNLGNLLQRQGHLVSANQSLTEALQLAEKFNYDTLAMKALLDLGNVAYDAGKIRQAIEHYRRSLALANKLDHKTIKAKTLLNMGMAHWQFDNVEQAIALLNQAAEMFRALDDQSMLGMTYNNLGLIYFSEKQHFDSAAYYYDAALKIREGLGSPVPIAYVLVNQGNLLVAKGNITDARALFERALKIFERAGMLSQQARIYYHLGEANLSASNTAKAIGYFEKTLKLAEENNIEPYVELARNYLLDLYAAASDWPSFSKHFIEFRKSHAQLQEELTAGMARESALRDTLSELQANYAQLMQLQQGQSNRIQLLESILLSLAAFAVVLVLLIIGRKLLNRAYLRHQQGY